MHAERKERLLGYRTCSEGQESHEGDGMGGEAPVERAGCGIVDVGHCGGSAIS